MIDSQNKRAHIMQQIADLAYVYYDSRVQTQLLQFRDLLIYNLNYYDKVLETLRMTLGLFY